MCKATNCAKVTKIAKNFSLKRRGKGGQDCTHLYESQCFFPRGYLNWDKFLSSNFVMLSMYRLQLTTTKFLTFVYLDRPFILNTN